MSFSQPFARPFTEPFTRGFSAAPGAVGTELITNGTFDGNDSTGWSLATNWTIQNERAEYDDSGSPAFRTMDWQNLANFSVGKRYRVKFDLGVTSGRLNAVGLGDVGNAANNFFNYLNTSGTYEADLIAPPSSSNFLRFRADGSAGFVGWVDNISLLDLGYDDAVFNDLAIWLDEEDMVHSGTTFTSWTERKTGQSLTSTSGGLVVENYNGQAGVVAYDNDNNSRPKMTCVVDLSGDLHMFVYANINALGSINSRTIFSIAENGGADLTDLEKSTDGNHATGLTRGGVRLVQGGSPGLVPQIFEVSVGGTTGTIRRNNNGPTIGPVGAPGGTTNLFRFFHDSSNFRLDAAISCVLILPRVASAAERVTLYNYLAAKAGMTPI